MPFKSRLLAFNLFVGLIALAGCEKQDDVVNGSKNNRVMSTSVHSAHAKHESAHAIFDSEMKSPGGTIDVRNASHKLLMNLQSIDTSKCPDDYREQCDNYITELKTLCSVLDSHPEKPPESEREIAAADESQKHLLDAIEKVNQSGERVRELATKYGAAVGH